MITEQEADTLREALEEQRRPGVRWRLENLGRLAKANPKKLEAQAEASSGCS